MKKVIGFLLSTLLAVFFISCEIGLGEAVDTEAPSLTILAPEPDAVIRNAFRFSGEWSDDGEIADLSITLERTDGIAVNLGSYPGVIQKSESGANTWYCVVDPLDKSLPVLDGTYVGTVSIKDTAEHVTIQTRQFTIDNTAPVVVLQRPSTKTGSASFDSYGQKLTIEGQAADDTNIDHIDVMVYEDAGFTSLLKTVTLKNVPPTISLDFADYLDTSSTDYTDIYKSAGLDGTKNRYCKIKVYDDAQCYPADGSAQKAEDKLGNATDQYYLYSDLSSTVLLKHKVTEVYHMMNGTYSASNSSRSAESSDVISKLSGSVLQSSQFSMNPDNSPSFVVSGRSVLEAGHKLSEDSYGLTSGNNQLEVEVSPGLDKISIDPDTIGFYLQECDENGVLDAAKAPVWLVKQLKDKQGNILLDDSEKAARVVPVLAGSTYKFKTTDVISPVKYPGVVIGSYYRVIVVGNDTTGNDISNLNKYGFKLASAGDFIELSVTSTPTWVTSVADALVDDNSVDHKKSTVTLSYSGSGPFKIFRNDDVTEIAQQAADTDEWSDSNIEITNIDSSTIIKKDENNKYYIKYHVEGFGDAKSNDKTVYFKLDNDKPTVSNIEYPSSTDTEMSSFRFTGKASDGSGSGIQKVMMQITDIADSTKTVAIKMNGSDDWYKDIKPVDYAASGVFATEGKKKVEIWAVDGVGLKSDVITKSDWIYDTAKPEIAVPSYKTLKAAPATGETSAADYETETSISDDFSLGKVFSLAGSVSDNAGIKNVTITQDGEEIYSDSSTSYEVLALPRDTTSSTTAKTVASLLPAQGQETYQYVITVEDKSGKTSEKKFKITVDKEPPVVTLGALPKAADTKSTVSSYSFVGTAKDTGTGVKEVYISVEDVADSTRKYEAKVDGTQNWIYSLEYADTNWTPVFVTEGEKKVTLRAVDNAGNETRKFTYAGVADQTEKTFIYDKNNPESTLTGTQEYIPAGGYLISGTAKDSYKLGKIVITQVKGVNSKTIEKTLSAVRNTAEAWSATIPELFAGEASLTEGEYEFAVKVVDSVGNEKQIGSFTSKVDLTAPTVVISSPDGKTGANSINKNEKTGYGFYGSITEANAVNAVYYKIVKANADGTFTAPAIPVATDALNQTQWTTNKGWTAAASSKTSWNFTQSFKANCDAGTEPGEGNYKLYIRAVDAAGNISSEYTKAFDVDMDAPEVTVTAPEYVNASTNANSTKKVNFTGTINESNKLTSFKIYRNNTEIKSFDIVNAAEAGKIISNPNNDTWSYEDEVSADGTYEYKFVATDVATKTNTEIKKTVIVDTVVPTVDATAITTPTPLQTENTLFKFIATAACASDNKDSSNNPVVSSGFSKAGILFTSKVLTADEEKTASEMMTVDLSSNSAAWNSTVEFASAQFNGVFGTEGKKYIYFRAYDKVNNVSAWAHKEFTYDTSKPTIEFTDSASPINPEEGSYINYDFTLKVEADDTYGVDSVIVTEIKKYTSSTAPSNWDTIKAGLFKDIECTTAVTGEYKPGTYYIKKWNATNTANTKEWTKDLTVGSGKDIEDGNHSFVITVKDKSGKTAETTRSFTVDTVAPVHVDSDSSVGGVATKSAVASSWYKSEALNFTGKFTDDTSKVTLEYIVTPDNESPLSKQELTTSKSGNTCTYNSIISGFKEGTGNTIKIVAVDEAGNRSSELSYTIRIDSTSPSFNSSFYTYDDSNLLETTGAVLTNGLKDMILYGLISDTASGVGGLTYSIGGTEIAAANLEVKYSVNTLSSAADFKNESSNWKTYSEITDKTTITAWRAVVKSAALSSVNSTVDFRVKPVDTVGNGESQKMFSLTVDRVPPAITYTPFTDADSTTAGTQVNGKLILSGTASDNTQLSAVTGIEYQIVTTATTAPNKNSWVTLPTTNLYKLDSNGKATSTATTDVFASNTGYSWKTNAIDTKALFTDSITKDVYVYFRAIATDAAGNSSDKVISSNALVADNGTYTTVAYVNQDSDRPVIKFTSLNLTADMAKAKPMGYESSEITGTISDDDGVPTDLQYKIGSDGTYTTTNLTYSTNDGMFTLSLTDNQYEVFFKVTDSEGKDFESSASSVYDINSVKVTDKTGTKYGYKSGSGNTLNSTLNLVIDTTPPEVTTPEFTRTPANSASWSTAISSAVFGGTQNEFYIRQYAYDVNTVKSVYLSIPSNTNDSTVNAVTSWTYVDGTTNLKTRVYTSNSAPAASGDYWLTSNTSGTKDGTITSVTASSGKVTAIVVGGKTYTKDAYIFNLTKQSDTWPQNSNYNMWKTVTAINVTGLVTGTRSASMVADDGIRSSSTTISLVIDFTPPEIKVNSPTDNGASSGSITAYGSVDCTAKVYYAVSTSGTVNPETTTAVTSWTDDLGISTAITDIHTKDLYGYKEIEDASISWFVYFDNDVAAATGTHQLVLNEYLVNYGITTKAALEATDSTQFDKLVKMYIWIKAVDESGNIAYKVQPLTLDPQGDRPSVSFSYPTKDGDTYGGEIRLTGSATDEKATVADNIGVESVWAQIISSTHEFNKTYDDEGNVTSDPWTGKTFGSFTKNSETNKITAFAPTKDDLDYLVAAGYELYNMRTYHTEATHTAYAGTIASGYTAKDYAIRCTLTGSSWSLSINNSGKNELDVGTGTNDVAIRIYAQDKDGKFSTNTDRDMVFDAQNPIIGNKQKLYLIQSSKVDIDGTDAAPDFNITSSREYTEDMYVRGNWYLIGSVEDNDTINTLKVNNESLTVSASTKSTNYATKVVDGGKIVYFKYKLATGSSIGNLKFNIYAEDKATPTAGKTTKAMNIYYDNKAPDLLTATDNRYNINPSVKQSDGFYHFSSVVSEPTDGNKVQSGLDYVAFYFMRRNTAAVTEVDTIYNPMLKTSNTKTVSGSTTLLGAASETDIVYDSGLYWLKKTVTRSTTLNSLGFTTNSDIRENGLVKIGGSIYKITGKTAGGVTINGNPPQSETTAYFAYAMVIDNTVQENGGKTKNENGYPSTISNDDGDGMVEYVKKSGTDWTWEADIVSKNIPDGPIELHYVAFDAAGNYSIGIMGNWTEAVFIGDTNAVTPDRTEYKTQKTAASRTSNVLYVDGESKKSVYNGITETITNTNLHKASFIANNAPRLAAVTIWTDYNGDKTHDDGETKVFYYNEKQVISGGSILKRAGGHTDKLIVSGNGNDYDDTVTGTPYMTIRDETWFTPEVVGGNGSLYYKKRVATKADLGTKAYSSLSSAFITGNGDSEDYLDATGTYVDTDTPKTRRAAIKFGDTDTDNDGVLDDFATYCTSSNGTYWFDYQIWDSTEGTTIGTNSLSATMRLALNVDYFDTTKPITKIKPFFWEDKDENSIAWDVNGTSKTPLGHIELEKDWKEVSSYNSAATSGITDSDPKVSGTIVIRGTAYDNIRLKQLYVMFDSHSALGTYKLGAEYGASGWVGKSGTGWKFTASDEYATSEGHSANWELTVDTSKIANIAELDKFVRVFAVDARGTATDTTTISGTSIKGNTSVSTATTQTTTEEMTSYYKMDVVPYVTELVTNLSALESSSKAYAKTAYSRTALGYYPVAENEKIEIKGFNLGNGTTAPVVKIGATTMTTGTASPDSIPAVEIGTNTSDTITVTVNSIVNINGTNNTTAAYNIINNGLNNATLHDDVKVKVWNFKKIADPVAVEQIMYPTVKMSPADGRIGASFANSYYFHMAGYGNNGSTWYSHTPFLCGYDGSDANSFAFDKNGYTYGGVQYRASDLPSEGGSFNFVFSTAKPEGDMSLADVYRCNTGSARLENNCTNLKVTPTKDKTEWAYNKWRVKSPQFVAVANADSTVTTVYSAYYDSTTKQIRYRKGKVDAAGLVGNNSGFGSSGDLTSIGDTYMMLDTNDSLKDIWHMEGTEREVTVTEEVILYCEWYNENTSPQYYYSKVERPNTWGSEDEQKLYFDKELTSQVGTNYKIAYENNQLWIRDENNSWATIGYFTLKEKKVDTVTETKTVSTGQKTTGGYVNDVMAYPGFTDKTGQGGGYDSNRGGNFGNRHVNAPDSLQTENDQIIHVLGSNGLTGDVQDVYKKSHYSNGAGKYVALGVLSDGKAVIAWYDDVTKHLLIAKEPTFTGDALTPNAGTNFANSYARTTAWEGATKDLGSGGEYVQLVVDSDNNIHVAHYDSATGGELKYIKLDSSMTVKENVTIDAYDDVGSHLTINVGKDKDGNQIPYIGYYGRKHAKMAYRVNSEKASGADSDKVFTHNWEVTYVPTADTISENAENTVNVAVWTKANGDLAKSASGTNTAGTFNGNIGAAGDTIPCGQVYANGTNNPIIAYVSASGALEYGQINSDDTEIEFK